ncbi:MAG: DUF2922 family protein [Clostridiales bacterium]|jgi:hypothetical protein|nr:DUF2922 family protein [Clostridiales bacterium]
METQSYYDLDFATNKAKNIRFRVRKANTTVTNADAVTAMNKIRTANAFSPVYGQIIGNYALTRHQITESAFTVIE